MVVGVSSNILRGKSGESEGEYRAYDGEVRRMLTEGGRGDKGGKREEWWCQERDNLARAHSFDLINLQAKLRILKITGS